MEPRKHGEEEEKEEQATVGAFTAITHKSKAGRQIVPGVSAVAVVLTP